MANIAFKSENLANLSLNSINSFYNSLIVNESSTTCFSSYTLWIILVQPECSSTKFSCYFFIYSCRFFSFKYRFLQSSYSFSFSSIIEFMTVISDVHEQQPLVLFLLFGLQLKQLSPFSTIITSVLSEGGLTEIVYRVVSPQ